MSGESLNTSSQARTSQTSPRILATRNLNVITVPELGSVPERFFCIIILDFIHSKKSTPGCYVNGDGACNANLYQQDGTGKVKDKVCAGTHNTKTKKKQKRNVIG